MDDSYRRRLGLQKLGGIFTPKKTNSCIILPKQEDCKTVKSFIDAIANDSLEDALAYVSKRFLSKEIIDLKEFKRLLCEYENFKYLNKAEFVKLPINMNKKSVLFMNRDRQNTIIHMYMVKEPDLYGYWKIYGLENEREM